MLQPVSPLVKTVADLSSQLPSTVNPFTPKVQKRAAPTVQDPGSPPKLEKIIVQQWSTIFGENMTPEMLVQARNLTHVSKQFVIESAPNLDSFIKRVVVLQASEVVVNDAVIDTLERSVERGVWHTKPIGEPLRTARDERPRRDCALDEFLKMIFDHTTNSSAHGTLPTWTAVDGWRTKVVSSYLREPQFDRYTRTSWRRQRLLRGVARYGIF